MPKKKCKISKLRQISLLCFSFYGVSVQDFQKVFRPVPTAQVWHFAFFFFCWMHTCIQHFQKVIEHCLFKNRSSVTTSCFSLGLFITQHIFPKMQTCHTAYALEKIQESMDNKPWISVLSQIWFFNPKFIWALLN